VAGIPARLGFADVRNHLSTERMRQSMQTDLFVWHGYAELWLDGAWRKATPAFNLSLCEKFGLHALDFDGVHDSIYHPFDKAGNRHMEYVNERGSFDDLPLARIAADFQRLYTGWMPGTELHSRLEQSDFEADVAREVEKSHFP
jgi:transglutaminase-like putative cysteine protease